MVAAVIVAAGKGVRMQTPLPKQYLSLAGLPVLSRTLLVFDACDPVDDIYLVVPKDDFDYCRRKIIGSAMLNKKIHLVPGGARRQESVHNGLQKIDANCRIVVIHDGVRPFVKIDQVAATIEGARKFGACILGVPVSETLKQVDASDHIVRTLQRDHVWMAQTPQTFRCELIKKAHDKAKEAGYLGTDDAALVERLGEPVQMIRGSRGNIKITHREDLEMAQCLMASDSAGSVSSP
jgi:2-C-methyl-D-erythritol 4-phosphate cytidylyltransferase